MTPAATVLLLPEARARTVSRRRELRCWAGLLLSTQCERARTDHQLLARALYQSAAGPMSMQLAVGSAPSASSGVSSSPRQPPRLLLPRSDRRRAARKADGVWRIIRYLNNESPSGAAQAAINALITGTPTPPSPQDGFVHVRSRDGEVGLQHGRFPFLSGFFWRPQP